MLIALSDGSNVGARPVTGMDVIRSITTTLCELTVAGSSAPLSRTWTGDSWGNAVNDPRYFVLNSVCAGLSLGESGIASCPEALRGVKSLGIGATGGTTPRLNCTTIALPGPGFCGMSGVQAPRTSTKAISLFTTRPFRTIEAADELAHTYTYGTLVAIAECSYVVPWPRGVVRCRRSTAPAFARSCWRARSIGSPLTWA